jgi:GxxExxY protein
MWDRISSRKKTSEPPAAVPEMRGPASLEENLLDRVAWATRTVYKVLGNGFDREIYLNAIAAELQRQGFLFERDRKYPISYRGVSVGEYLADLVVEGRLLLKVQCHGHLTEVDQTAIRSVLNQIHHPLGLVVDYGGSRIQMIQVEMTER